MIKRMLNPNFIHSVSIILGSLLLLSTTACSREPVREYGAFGKYVTSFEQNSQYYGKAVLVNELRITVAPLAKNKMASCTLSSEAVPTITINPDIWERLSEIERQNVMNHELGHCILNREHRDETTDDGLPISLMNSRSLSPDLYLINEKYYLKELYSENSRAPAAEAGSITLNNLATQ